MKTDGGLTEQDWHILKEAVSRYPEIEEAVIFGSRAKGNYKPGSDVDIAVFGSKISHEIIAGLSYWLNEETLLPYRMDIVHFETIQTSSLKDHIQRVGMLLYKNSDQAIRTTTHG